jgi:hypothetical protein
MKYFSFKTGLLITAMAISIVSCKKQEQMSNGEIIFRTGKNKNGEVLYENTQAGQHSCQDCHGRTGGNFFNRKESIKFKDLSDLKIHKVPYTEALIMRFLDQKIKSDGSPSSSPINWQMNQQDKEDLVAFLRTL